MIGCFNCPIRGVQLQPTVDYTVLLQLYRMIKEKKAANALITFEEIVMDMIRTKINCHRQFASYSFTGQFSYHLFLQFFGVKPDPPIFNKCPLM